MYYDLFFDVVREIKNLNMGAEIRVGSQLIDPLATERIYCSVPGDKLKLPEGFYYNEKNGITNKHNSPTGAYISIQVEDISKASEFTSHDILEVDDRGLTKKEREYVNNEAKAGLDEEDKLSLRDRAVLFANDQGDSLVGLANRAADGFASFANNSGEKLVNTGKKLFCKAKGLYNRIANKFRKKKVEEVDTVSSDIGPTVAIPSQDITEETKMPSYSDMSNALLMRMVKDDYIIGRIRTEIGLTLEDDYKANPSGVLNKLRDYAVIMELHNFAVKDVYYDELEFRRLEKIAIGYRYSNRELLGNILGEIKYGNITENQMKYLSEKLEGFVLNNNQNIGPTVAIPKEPKVEAPAPEAPVNNTQNPQKVRVVFKQKQNTSQTPTPVELTEADKRSAEVQKAFNESKKGLYDKLGAYEKAFVDDAAAEWVEPGDNEFNQMLNGRAVDKEAIFNYYSELNKLKSKMNYDLLDDMEKTFVDDAKAKNLAPSDDEFRQMMGERTVNQSRVLNYYKSSAELTKSNENLAKAKAFFGENYTEQNVIEGKTR